MARKKPAINLSGLPVDVRRAQERKSKSQKAAHDSGFGCTKLVEPVPNFLKAFDNSWSFN